jgi:hypothetical protein
MTAIIKEKNREWKQSERKLKRVPGTHLRLQRAQQKHAPERNPRRREPPETAYSTRTELLLVE